ncbi:MAG: complex I NDUFA9 subunit family protein [Parvularcula sp.]|jgi:NADH dehydrogenase|nr:complex I NDUFA9 subunit family protein [Parvularcula sp.]
MSKLVTVFGASGFVGRNVVRELAKRGYRVRAAVRHPHQANFLQPMGVVGQIQLFQANIRYPNSVADALYGADACVNLVGILAEGGRQTFKALQADGARIVAEECRKAGITNFVQMSAIGADPESESEYARTKAEGERAVREALPGATVIRPSIVFGTQDDFFNRFAGMARMAPALPLIGGGNTRFQPVYVDDVADAVVKIIAGEAPTGETYELGGPEIMTFRELLELMLKIVGRRRALVPLPFFIAKPMGRAGDLANKLPLVQAPITSDQVKLLKRDNVVSDGAKGFADLGITPETMDAVLPTYLFRYRKQGQFSPEVPV